MEQGARHGEVGVALGVHHSIITRAWLRHQQYGIPVRRHDRGRQRVTTAAQDSQAALFLIIQARRGQFATATHLGNDPLNAYVCTKTVHRRLHEGYLRSRP